MEVRWNTNFVRGLAQSVLERARVIRNGLVQTPAKVAKVSKKAKAKVKPKSTGRRKVTVTRKSGRHA